MSEEVKLKFIFKIKNHNKTFVRSGLYSDIIKKFNVEWIDILYRNKND